MRRLCTDSSRSYLGRSARHGGVVLMADNGFWVVPYPKRPGAEIVLPDLIASELAAAHQSHAARRAEMHRVRPQKSAEAIVVVRRFTRVADHEGPNM